MPGLVIVAAVAGGQILTGDRITLVAFAALAPLATALIGSVRQVVAVAAAAVAFGVADGLAGGTLTNGQHLVRIAVVVLVGAAAVYAVVLRNRRDIAFARITAVAEVAQRAVLRPLPSCVGGVHLAACYHSAAHAARIGGDLYEAADTRHGVRLVIGDVRGNGLGAVRLAAGVLGAFRLSAHTRASLLDVARDLDGYVARDGGGDEEFVTALIVEFRPPGAMLVSCGHQPPVVLHAGRATVRPMEGAAPPLGLGGVPRPVTIALSPGDRLVLYTDGVGEARDPAGRFFDIEGALRGADGGDERGVAEMLVERLRRHVGGPLHDDAAVVVARPAGASLHRSDARAAVAR